MAKSRRVGRISPSSVPFWLLVALAAVSAGKILWLSTNPKIIVLGKTPVSANYLQSSTVYEDAAHRLLAGSITGHSKLTVNVGGTVAGMERDFPELQNVSMGIPLINSRPILYLQLAQPSLVLQSSHGNYALNSSGIVLARLQSIPAQVPMVVDQSNAMPNPGKQFLPSSTVNFIQTVAYQLAAAKLTVSTFVLPAASPYEVDARLNGKPYVVRYNLQADALTQSGVTVAAIQHLGNATTPGEYIDVRVPGRAYYK